MWRFLCILCCWCTSNACADDIIWRSVIVPISTNSSIDTRFTFQRQLYDFAGVQDDVKRLDIAHQFNRIVALRGQVSLRKHNSESGVCKLNLKQKQYEIMPTLAMSADLVLGLGYQRILGGDLNLGVENDFRLERGDSWFISAQLAQLDPGESLELRVANHAYQAHQYSPMEQDRYFTENSIRLRYQLIF